MLALSKCMLPHLTMGIILGPPLEMKGGFRDIMNVKWLAQGTCDKHISSCYWGLRLCLQMGHVLQGSMWELIYSALGVLAGSAAIEQAGHTVDSRIGIDGES